MITILKFLLVVMYVLCSLSLIFVVLLQQGKGAGMGASLGGGASQTLFGSRAPTFISRFTGVLAAVFFLGAIALAKWPPFRPADAVDADGILQLEEVAPAAPEAPATESATPADEQVLDETANAAATVETATEAPPATEASTETVAPTDNIPAAIDETIDSGTATAQDASEAATANAETPTPAVPDQNE